MISPETTFALLTITHEPELSALRLQAKSINAHINPRFVNSIVVIVNQKKLDSFVSKFSTQVLPEYGAHSAKVQLIHRDELAAISNWRHGWRSQQLLKLLGCQRIGNKAVIILDSKNHFIQNIEYNSYFSTDGRIKSWITSHAGHMENYFHASMKFMGLNNKNDINSWPPTVTPFPVYGQDINDLLQRIRNLHSYFTWESFLERSSLLTEFFLIAAHQKEKYSDLRQIYDFGPARGVILFRDKVTDLNRFESAMFLAYRPSTLSFAIHHGAFGVLSDAQRRRIIDLWRERGLILSADEAKPFLLDPYNRQ